MRGNPLICDCNFAGAQSAAGHLSVFEGSCDKPNELRGKNINSLKLWELCRKFFYIRKVSFAVFVVKHGVRVFILLLTSFRKQLTLF